MWRFLSPSSVKVAKEFAKSSGMSEFFRQVRPAFLKAERAFQHIEDQWIRLDWEHVEMRWCPPQEMKQMNTVPGLWQAWCRVAGRFESSPE